MPKDDAAYLLHIKEDIIQIEQYTRRMNYQKFLKNKLVQDGIIRRLEIIGEAVKNLSESFCTEHVEVPWKQWARMRDKLIHYYHGVDLDAVWDTYIKDLPLLKQVINESLKLSQIKE